MYIPVFESILQFIISKTIFKKIFKIFNNWYLIASSFRGNTRGEVINVLYCAIAISKFKLWSRYNEPIRNDTLGKAWILWSSAGYR